MYFGALGLVVSDAVRTKFEGFKNVQVAGFDYIPFLVRIS
jgi:hypothetical protein